MTTAQQPRHRAAGAQGFGREPHPSGPIVVTPRRSRSTEAPAPVAAAPVASAPVADEPMTMPIPRAALDAALHHRPMPPAMPVGPVAPFSPAAFAPAPVGSPPAGGTGPGRRRRWPWVVAAILLLLVIIASTNRTPTTPTVPAPAPAVAAPTAPAAAPATVTLPGDVVGRNAQIVSGELTGLGLTNVTYASRDAEDTVVVLLQNWTVTGIEPGAGTAVAPGDAVVVTVTKAGAASAPAASSAAPAAPAAGPATSFGDGTHVVGQDIEAGTYKTAGPSSSSFGACYWARLSNTSGEFDAIITNGVPTGQATVTIRSGDAAFETSGCQTWTKVR